MPTTYNQLIADAPLWLYANNRDLVATMPKIVADAHEQIIGILDHDLFRTLIPNKTLLASNFGVLDLSAEDPRILEIRAIRMKYRSGADDWVPLMRRDLETLSMLYARNRPRQPTYYAAYSGPLVVKAFPAPDRNYDLQISANVEPPVLSPSQQTNIVAEQFPRVVEKATYRQAALFMKNWEDAKTYEKEMIDAVNEANAQIQRRKRDVTETRPVDTTNVEGV
jgi:hypothetical protein